MSRYAAGQHLNVLNRAVSVTSANAVTEFPAANAIDKKSVTPVIMAAGVDTPEIVSANLAWDTDGDFEGTFVGGIPPGWTNAHSGGTSGKETSIVKDGTGALYLRTSNQLHLAQITRDYAAAPGETIVLRADMRIDGPTGGAVLRARIYDRRTRKYFNPATGLWQTTPVDAIACTDTAYTAKEVLATLDRDFGDSTSIRVTLRYSTPSDVSGLPRNGYVDNFRIFSAWDGFALVGHNIDSGSVVSIEGLDPSGVFWTPLATATYASPSMYGLASQRQTYQKIRVTAIGTNTEQLVVGEVLVVQLADPGHSWSEGLKVDRVPKETRAITPAGRAIVTPISVHAPRRVTMDLRLMSDAHRLAFLEDLALRTRLGAELVFLIPDTDVPHCYYARIVNGASSTRMALSPEETTSLTFEEDGFPTVGLGV